MPRPRRVRFAPTVTPLEDRLTPADYGLDPTFGGADALLTGGGTDRDSRNDIRELRSISSADVQPDGRLVAVGRFGPDNLAAVVRLNPDGTLDPTFGGGDGVAEILFARGTETESTNSNTDPSDPGSFGLAAQVKVLSNGQILVAADVGISTPADPLGRVLVAVTRLAPDGTVDTGFGNAGVVKIAAKHVATTRGDGVTPLDSTNSYAPSQNLGRLVPLGDGRVLVAMKALGVLYPVPASAIPAGAPADMAEPARTTDTLLTLLRPDGSPDPGFGSGGSQ